MVRSIILALLGVAGFAGEAHAEWDPCTARAVTSVEVPSFSEGGFDRGWGVAKGQTFQFVTQYWQSKTGVRYFCSHGGGCYLAEARVNGVRVPVVALDNCRIDYSDPYKFEDGTLYSLTPIRSKFSARDLRQWDATEAFYKYKVQYDRIDQYAVAYANNPRSACAKLTRRVMRGDRRAIRAMNKDIDAEGNVVNPCIWVSK
ncbi:hypothetical protein [Sphingomonas bacterium]|uniref:hypothetical protein n=1 Tax=Sphingomonas bacterium TaxID=1895847 RepID=UPI00260D1103|nr:hypothetical protein [Sphingomonas bacterium]